MEEDNQDSEEQEPASVDQKTVMEEIEILAPDDVQPSQEPSQTAISGFWRRLLAFVIDGSVVAIPLFILGFVIRDIAFTLGPWGRIIGYALIIPYWGYFNSEIRLGQTLGKRVSKIAVVDRHNNYLSLKKSFFRAIILGLIFMLNGWALSMLQVPVVAALLGGIVYGGSLVLIYGLVFNRTTRQGTHDLLARSYVIKAPPNLTAATPQIPRIHQRIIYGLLGVGLLIGVAGLLLQQNLPTLGVIEAGEWNEIQELQSSLMDSGEFFSVGVKRLNRSVAGNPTILKDLNIEVWAKTSCSHNPNYCDEAIKQIALSSFEEYENIEDLSGMRISVVNSFDFGLAKWSIAQGIAWSIEDWKKELEN